VQRFAMGPVLAITPCNYPLNLVAHKVAPALAAGCPVILKPAPETPFTALALGEVILKAGWPEEALAVLTLSNIDTAWLAEKEDRIKLVSFTGSAKVGWELKVHSGRKRVLLELGGNAALIVHRDWPDLDEAALRTAHAAFGYAGQSCVSVQRVFVERSIFQTFLWKVVEATANPLVALFSAPSCASGSLMRVNFQPQSLATPATTTNWVNCHPPGTMTFEIAGMYPSTVYQMFAQPFTSGKTANGPTLDFTTGALPAGVPFPTAKVIVGPGSSTDSALPVLLLNPIPFGCFTNPYPVDVLTNATLFSPQTPHSLTMCASSR